jgi:hypothetical protein
MAQQFRELVSLLTDMRFRWKDGTHKTLSNMILELNGMVTVKMVGAQELVGKLTVGIYNDSVWVKSVES